MNASLAKLLECYLCFVALLFFFYLFGWLAFWRGKFGKGTYTKVITHPHSLFIITYKKKLAELRMESRGSMAGTSKELWAVAHKNYYFYDDFISVEVFQSLERRQKCIYFYTELLNTSETHMLEIIFASSKDFNEQQHIGRFRL